MQDLLFTDFCHNWNYKFLVFLFFFLIIFNLLLFNMNVINARCIYKRTHDAITTSHVLKRLYIFDS